MEIMTNIVNGRKQITFKYLTEIVRNGSLRIGKVGENYMNGNNIQPLTENERKFASDNHNLIYAYLHKYGYDIETYYNIAVFGYLEAVQEYLRDAELQGKYIFPIIAFRRMRGAISNHIRMNNSQKRKPSEPVISLDAESEEMESLYNTTGGKSVESDWMEKEAISYLLENLSELQRKIAIAKVEGYSNKEILSMFNIPQSTFYKEIKRMQQTIGQIMSK